MELPQIPFHVVTATPAYNGGLWTVALALVALAAVVILDGYSTFHYTSRNH